MRKILFLLAITLPMIMCSCSSDDDGVDSNLIEGSWGLVHSEGFDKEDPSELLEWDFDCNPLSPSSYDDERIDIVKIEGNEYYMEYYYYSTYSKKWVKDDSYSMTIKGSTITPIVTDEDLKNASIKILDLTSTNMTIEAKQGSIYYTKSIYKRLK